MARHRKVAKRQGTVAAKLAGSVMAAGALVLLAPAGLASAEGSGDPSPGGTESTKTGESKPDVSKSDGDAKVASAGLTAADTPTYGVGNRPALQRPAPLVTISQQVGDGIFNDNVPLLNGSPMGAIYHTVFGSAGRPQNGDGVVAPGEAYQGSYQGVFNSTPVGVVYDTITGYRPPGPLECKAHPTLPGCSVG